MGGTQWLWHSTLAGPQLIRSNNTMPSAGPHDVYLYLCVCICAFVFVYLYLCLCVPLILSNNTMLSGGPHGQDEDDP